MKFPHPPSYVLHHHYAHPHRDARPRQYLLSEKLSLARALGSSIWQWPICSYDETTQILVKIERTKIVLTLIEWWQNNYTQYGIKTIFRLLSAFYTIWLIIKNRQKLKKCDIMTVKKFRTLHHNRAFYLPDSYSHKFLSIVVMTKFLIPYCV